MNFLRGNEFIVLMSQHKERAIGFEAYHELTIPEKLQLRVAGIQTSSEQPSWASIEPSRGQYNFDYMDRLIHINREADMKTIFHISGWRNPDWMPNEWFSKTKDGVYERELLSFWNEEAQEYSDKFYKMLYDKYDDPDIEFVFAEWQGGEGAMPPSQCYYDNAALEDYRSIFGTSAVPELNTPDTMKWLGDAIIKHFVRKTEILYPRYKEMWNMQQYLMQRWTPAFGNFVQTDIIRTYHELHPDGLVVLLQYTYYDDSHTDVDVQYVDMLRGISNCETIVEAMFSKGLPITTPKAIAHGFRGQIIHPAREPGAHLENYEIENIRNSHKLWMKSKGLE
jgi:hypothetical protein